MAKPSKWATLRIVGEGPMEILEQQDQAPGADEDAEDDKLSAVRATVRRYLEAGASLLAGKYHHLRDIAPGHLANPGNTLIAYTDDIYTQKICVSKVLKVGNGVGAMGRGFLGIGWHVLRRAGRKKKNFFVVRLWNDGGGGRRREQCPSIYTHGIFHTKVLNQENECGEAGMGLVEFGSQLFRKKSGEK